MIQVKKLSKQKRIFLKIKSASSSNWAVLQRRDKKLAKKEKY